MVTEELCPICQITLESNTLQERTFEKSEGLIGRRMFHVLFLTSCNFCPLSQLNPSPSPLIVMNWSTGNFFGEFGRSVTVLTKGKEEMNVNLRIVDKYVQIGLANRNSNK